MNGELTNDFQTLYEKMKKYNFNKPFKVSLTMEENGHEMELSKANNAFISPDYNICAETDNTQLKPTSPVTQSILPQHTTLPSHPIEVMCGSTSSQLKEGQQNHILNSVNLLSNNIINILKENASYICNWRRCGKTKALKNDCTMKYMETKNYYMNISRDIVTKTILPQGKNFDEKSFIMRTTLIANRQENLRCGYKHVEIVYREILNSCSKQVFNYEEMQICHSSNTMNNEQILPQQRSLQINPYVRQKNINTPESIMYQNPPTYYHLNNLTRTVSYGHASARQEYSTADESYNNTNQTVNAGLNSMLQPTYQNNHQSRDVMQTVNEGPSSILHPRYQNNHQSRDILQTLNEKSNYIQQSSYQNNQYSKHMIQTLDRPHNLEFQHFEIQNHSNRQGNASNQNMSCTAPTTCVFQYRNSDYEVRLDVNTQILNNVKKNSQTNKNLQIDDLTNINNQNISNNVKQPVQSTETLNTATIMPLQDLPLIQQEPIRSMSRDSGFISPCNNLINDLCNGKDMQENTCPDITYVTSLNPDAVQIPRGPCHVCGEITKYKCRGCYKYYYCTFKCQGQHWSAHKFECMNACM